MKIIILIPVWGRVATFQKFVDTYKTFSEKVVSVFLFSQEDKKIKHLLKIYSEVKGETYPIQCENLPLGRKMNAGIEWIRENFQDENYYLMTLGSDDLLNYDALMRLYESNIKNEVPFFGIDSCHAMDLSNNKVYYVKNSIGSVGAGRMIHKSIIEKGFDLYTPEKNSALDYDSAKSIFENTGIKDEVIVTTDVLIIDMKTKDNINTIKKLKNHLIEM